MIRITLALLLLALAGCVEAMPTHDENNRLLNQYSAPHQWMPLQVIDGPSTAQ